MDGLTTGSALVVDSDSSSTGTRNIASITQNHASATGATALALQVDAGRGLFIDTNLAAGGYAVEVDSEQTTTNVAKIASIATSGTVLEVSQVGIMTGTVIDITADAATTGTGINMSMDGLTTGSAFAVASDSADTGTRSIASIIQDHASASGSTTLYLRNDHATADALKAIGAVTVGVDNVGHDVKFFGATSGKSWLWDESADKMIITGDAGITGATTLTGATQQTGTLTVGVNDTGHDVKFFGATSGKYWSWDESADKMIIAGDYEHTGAFGVTGASTLIGTLTVGKKDLSFGSGALISSNDWGLNRHTQNGVSLDANLGGFDVSIGSMGGVQYDAANYMNASGNFGGADVNILMMNSGDLKAHGYDLSYAMNNFTISASMNSDFEGDEMTSYGLTYDVTDNLSASFGSVISPLSKSFFLISSFLSFSLAAVNSLSVSVCFFRLFIASDPTASADSLLMFFPLPALIILTCFNKEFHLC